MVDSYYSGGFRKRKRRKRTPASRRAVMLLDALFSATTVGSCILSLWCVTAPAFRPSEGSWWSVGPMLYPAAYALLVLGLMYWIVRWKVRVAAVTLLFLTVASFPLSRYFRIPLRKEYADPAPRRGRVEVLSYNVANRYTSSIVDYVIGTDTQIACLQELIFGYDSKWDRLSEHYPYTTLHAEVRYANAIYSKYRILRDGLVDSLSRHRAVWADIVVRGDTVRVVNLHLQHTAIEKSDEQAIQGMNSGQGDSIIRSMAMRLAMNNAIRAREAERVRDFVASSPYPTIVCGDFNDVPLSYTYRTIASGMRDAFREAGRGYSHTFAGFWNTLRIDYVLVSPGIGVERYEVDNSTRYSDHYPVKVKLKI